MDLQTKAANKSDITQSTMNGVKTIQKARGWRKCDSPIDCDYWILPGAEKHQLNLPDPLADTPEGWFEFGQIIKWVTEQKNLMFTVTTYRGDSYQADVYTNDGLWVGIGHGEFRTAIIEALTEAIRNESNEDRREDDHVN